MKDEILDYEKGSDFEFLFICLLLSVDFSFLYIHKFVNGLIGTYQVYNVLTSLMAAATCAIVFLCHRGTSLGNTTFSKAIMSLLFGMLVFFSFQMNTVISLFFTIIINVLLVMYWDCSSAGITISRVWIAITAGLAGLIMVGASGYEMIERILRIPIDPFRADMIPQVIMGLERVFNGQNPYIQIHRPNFVPWPLDFGYGPGLWAPYIIPYALNIDLRFLSILCTLAIPLTLVFAATYFSYHFKVIQALCLLLLTATIAFNANLFAFAEIGHTQIYWPIIVLFCYVLSKNCIKTASVCLGLLVLSRTSMIFITPILTIYLWKFHREKLLQCLLTFSVMVLIALGPFIIADAKTFYFNMYTKYFIVVKKYVWTNMDWISTTFGTTSFLVKNQYTTFIGPLQYLFSIGVWITSYFSMREEKHVLIWMSASLMVFSMTTIWPVSYIFFDVMIFFVFSVLFQFEWARPPLSRKAFAAFALGTFVFFVSISALFICKSKNITLIDIGDKSARNHLYRGFYNDELDRDSNTGYCWADNDRTSVIFTRRSGAAAKVRMICMPFSPDDRKKQTISVILNGRELGDKTLASGWHEISFDIAPGLLKTGINMMAMKFSYSLSPSEMGLSVDERKLSAAFDKIIIEPLDS
jgi:hypothetical protein